MLPKAAEKVRLRETKGLLHESEAHRPRGKSQASCMQAGLLVLCRPTQSWAT